MKSIAFSIPIFLLLATSPLETHAAENGAPFAVTGEQLDHAVPKGWKLAWMEGKPDGRYFAEYIPESEDINSWREGYLAIERLPYPAPALLKEIENSKTTIAELALALFVQRAKQTCGGQYESMPQIAGTFNNVFFAIRGGFCDRYGPAAPFGEGALVAFAQGHDYLFRIHYNWRPKSAQEANNNLPWRITQQAGQAYLEAIEASSLCAGVGQPSCKNIYVR